MIPWKSPIHYRLYLQGYRGRARQEIIDIATARMMDPVALGTFIASMNPLTTDKPKKKGNRKCSVPI